MTLASTAKGDIFGQFARAIRTGSSIPSKAPRLSRIGPPASPYCGRKREWAMIFFSPGSHAHRPECHRSPRLQSQDALIRGRPATANFRLQPRGTVLKRPATVQQVTEQTRGFRKLMPLAVSSTNTSSSVSVVQRQAGHSFAQPQEVVATVYHGPSMKKPSAKTLATGICRLGTRSDGLTIHRTCSGI